MQFQKVSGRKYEKETELNWTLGVENKIIKEHSSSLFTPSSGWMRGEVMWHPWEMMCSQGCPWRTTVNLLTGVPLTSLPFVRLLFRSFRTVCSYYLYLEKGIREPMLCIIFSCD